jgi:large subunit ribosomal protein L35
LPKMKSHRGAAKRFKITSTGKIRRRRAFGNHMFEKKSPKRKRHLKTADVVAKSDAKRVRRMLAR